MTFPCFFFSFFFYLLAFALICAWRKCGKNLPLLKPLLSKPLISNIKAEVDPSYILAGYYGFNANISFTFQAIRYLYAYITYQRFWLFCKPFWVYLGRNSFSQRISEIYGNKTFGRFDVILKLEFEKFIAGHEFVIHS